MFVPDNIHDGGPQKVGARPGYILKFYDSSIPESQYYKYEDILGFERGSGKFFIYLKGAKDVNAKDKIGIFGDYDVDGATSTALLGNYFSELRVNFDIYIPDRKNEGLELEKVLKKDLNIKMYLIFLKVLQNNLVSKSV